MKINNWTLVNQTTGKPVNKGDIVTDFRGDKHILTGGTPPHKPGSTGRVLVLDDAHNIVGEYFPSVINARWVNI